MAKAKKAERAKKNSGHHGQSQNPIFDAQIAVIKKTEFVIRSLMRVGSENPQDPITRLTVVGSYDCKNAELTISKASLTQDVERFEQYQNNWSNNAVHIFNVLKSGVEGNFEYMIKEYPGGLSPLVPTYPCITHLRLDYLLRLTLSTFNTLLSVNNYGYQTSISKYVTDRCTRWYEEIGKNKDGFGTLVDAKNFDRIADKATALARDCVSMTYPSFNHFCITDLFLADNARVYTLNNHIIHQPRGSLFTSMFWGWVLHQVHAVVTKTSKKKRMKSSEVPAFIRYWMSGIRHVLGIKTLDITVGNQLVTELVITLYERWLGAHVDIVQKRNVAHDMTRAEQTHALKLIADYFAIAINAIQT